jgi:MFS family permease
MLSYENDKVKIIGAADVKDLKSLTVGFYKIFAIGLFQSIGTNISGSLFSMYAALYFNASMTSVGLLVSINTLASTLIVIPSGILSDKFRRKPLIIIGVAFGLVGTTILFFASNVAMLFVAQILLGVSWPIFGPSIQALVADRASPSRSGKAVGLYLLGPSIGMFLGPLIASFLLRFVSIRETYLYSLVAIIPALILAFLIGSAGYTQISSSRNRASFGKVFRNRDVMITSLACGSFFFILQSVITFYPIYALQNYYTDPAMIATVFSFMYFFSMIARILAVTLINSRTGEKRLIVTALMVSALVALLPLMRGLEQSAILVALVGVAHGIIYPMGAMTIAMSTTTLERGIANSIYMLFTNLSAALSPTLMGFVAESWGITLLFPLLAVASIIGLTSSRYMHAHMF